MSDRWYPEKPAQFTQSGIFAALIAVTDEQHVLSSWKGVSACVMEIEQLSPENRSGRYVYVSEQADSDESRAYVAGVAGVLESLAPDSTVTIQLRAKWVVDSLNELLAQWKENDWKNNRGEAPRILNIWKRVDKVKSERRLTVQARHISKSEEALNVKIEELRQMAREQRDEQSTKVGSPNARFTIEKTEKVKRPKLKSQKRKRTVTKRKVRRAKKRQ